MRKLLVIAVVMAAMAGVVPVDAMAEEPAVQTESALAERGIEYLDDAALRALVVGNILTIRNLESGEYFEARYGTDGTRTIQSLSEESTPDAATALSAPYVIHDSRVTTSYHGKVFEIRVYTVGGRYLAALSTDLGAVNWEIGTVK